MHEIVTLQFGKRANYLLTHFWNTQESYFTYSDDQQQPQEESPVDHDVSFRQGRAADGSDTYTPRTLIYDFKQDFGSLRKINELYEVLDVDQSAASTTWRGDSVPHRQPAIAQNEYQAQLSIGAEPADLTDDNVRYWSDFNRVYYNPKSIAHIYETELDPSARAFDDWTHGEALFDSLNRQSDFYDEEARPLIEECDQMQGLQLFASVDDGWSSFSAKYLERLRDEVGKMSIWTWGLSSAKRDSGRLKRLLNQARALTEMAEFTTTYVPLTDTPRHSLLEDQDLQTSHWAASGLQVVGVESILLPTRLRGSQHVSLDHLGMLLNLEGTQQIAQLSWGLPSSPAANGAIPVKSASSWNQGIELYPAAEAETISDRLFAQLHVERTARLTTSTINGALHDEEHDNRTERYWTSLRFPVLSSFPKRVLAGDPAQSVETHSSLVTSAQTGDWLAMLEARSRVFAPTDEREGLCSGLLQMRDAYRSNDFDDSDQGDDWD